MKIRNPKSKPPGNRHIARRPVNSTGLSCAEARLQRDGPLGKGGPLNQLPEFKIPGPLRIDQEELCQAVERAAIAGGQTGAAARKLLKLLQPHLLKEETDLLKILGLLMPLCRGQITSAMRQVLPRTEHLKAEMFEIVREHAEIIEAAHELRRAAETERKLSLVTFTEHLMLRAWTDELVFYPAAILIGEYLKLRFAESPDRQSRINS
ncbi:MAG: hypothetical protein ACRED1_13600 [Limisphaerales bacterium]